MFCCPVHADRNPSCALRDDGLVTCFAGCPRQQVEAALDTLGFPNTALPDRSNPGCEYDDRSIAIARYYWDQATVNPAQVEKYLRRRGITLPVPEVLRPSLIFDPGDRSAFIGFDGILAAVQQLDGSITAVHNKGGNGKACTFGRPGDGAVQLSAPSDGELGLAEGIETALSATQLTGVPCWATIGAKRLGVIALPASVRRVHLFADNDDPGQQAVALATTNYTDSGRHVRRWWPPKQHKDWNDVITGECRS
jgi:hypothetical protein